MPGNRMDLTTFLGTLAEGMKALAKGVETVADRLDTLARQQEKQEQGASAEKSGEKGAEPNQKKKKASSKNRKTPVPASERVYAIIAENSDGISIDDLREQTKFGSKKLHNIVYKLKKQNRVKSERRGVYKVI